MTQMQTMMMAHVITKAMYVKAPLMQQQAQMTPQAQTSFLAIQQQ
jgi:hypothetical protein